VVAGQDEDRDVAEGGELGGDLGVLGAVVGEIAGDQDDVDRRGEGQQVRRDAAQAVAGLGRPVQVGITQVGDHGHGGLLG
jgi:hypothetical protein